MSNFLNPIFIIPFSTGIIFVIGAYLTMKFPPKKINSMYGYRTKRSMKSQARWDFAQEYSSYLMARIGGVLILLGILGHFTSFSNAISTGLGIVIVAAATIYMLVKTENGIKNQFGS